ncbi:Alpha/Beta hydrolase protein [Bombardia bombarda]|uniref:Alpha/Beta hydrolase protein n=1 Tax=Bombardia bombarda TaxID=252184 RepID=A0AA39XML8_9PEZI|nr:Alpha/Beta hydrolase protein [Bombardia bombarda]
MGFFGRSKKVKKDAPSIPVKDRNWSPPQYHRHPPHPSSQPLQPWCPNGHYHPQAHFHPAGLLPPPPPPQPPTQLPITYPPPIIVNQHHYYLALQPSFQAAPGPNTSSGPMNNKSNLNLGSTVDLAASVFPGADIPQLFDDGLPAWYGHRTQLLNQSAALCDQISNRFSEVLTSIDRDRYTGNEKDLFTWQPGQPLSPQTPPSNRSVGEKGLPKTGKKGRSRDSPKGQTTAVAASVISGNYFSKVELYANSRLPMDLPPLRLYIPNYPLLCLAAQYSERVYERPTGAERDAHVDADWRTGTKAMVIKSVPMDYMNTIVFAIRGTATFMDWAVNLNMAPASPIGFLDDPGNFCHSGFLCSARKMIAPVAQRLRQLLEEDPGRASYSLLITGHSAGGAIAALLYSHMLSTSKAAESELNILTGCFKRVHCITFGTPPVSLMPLTKPEDFDRRPQLRKSLFMSFINEGDPVARADKAYVKSLLELFAAPAPIVTPIQKNEGSTSILEIGTASTKKPTSKEKEKEKASKASLLSAKTGKSAKSKSTTAINETAAKVKTQQQINGPVWKVPPCTLSSAGRIVVLRSGDPRARLRGKNTVEERLNAGVVAHIATDEQLREVIWGDPLCHVMKLYAGRIETLAVGAVTARGY